MYETNEFSVPEFRILNLPKLKTIAHRWARDYPEGFIKSIDLYSYTSYYGKLLGKKSSVKYLIVFTIWTIFQVEEEIVNLIEHLNYGCSSCEMEEAIGQKPYEKLSHATGKYRTINEGYPDLVHADFEDVYSDGKPEDNFIDKWLFLVIQEPNDKLSPLTKIDGLKDPGENLPKGVRSGEPHVNLFRQEVTINMLHESDEERQLAILISDLVPKLNAIWDELVGQVGFTRTQTNGKQKRKKVALAVFESDDFSPVRRHHLDDDNLYEYGGGQEKRNFIKKLLQKVVDEKGFSRRSQKELYEIYKKKK
jgi:hypothetical protein